MNTRKLTIQELNCIPYEEYFICVAKTDEETINNFHILYPHKAQGYVEFFDWIDDKHKEMYGLKNKNDLTI